ncbi:MULTISPECIES: winged helix-turn-helix transcriptional regulator [Snodgrassella]|uniref:winged helix-turn-helix transcriptional regulator n=1 Tax=Snodgrassella TaxID=1193515 RepID=UPI00352FF86A
MSFKTLINTLKELERDKLIFRKDCPQIPQKVEYGLLERGKSLVPVLDMLCEWGSKHKNDVL